MDYRDFPPRDHYQLPSLARFLGLYPGVPRTFWWPKENLDDRIRPHCCQFSALLKRQPDEPHSDLCARWLTGLFQECPSPEPRGSADRFLHAPVTTPPLLVPCRPITSPLSVLHTCDLCLGSEAQAQSAPEHGGLVGHTDHSTDSSGVSVSALTSHY